MIGFITFIHVIVAVLLITIILMQSGRGGGLTEAFSSAENFFGAKTNEVLIKGTTILVSIFIVTCLSLAYFSSKRDQSLMANIAAKQKQSESKEKFSESVPEEAVKEEPATSPMSAAETQAPSENKVEKE